MSDFLVYWRSSTVDELPNDSVLHFASSNNFTRMGVRPGDVIWAVTSREVNDLRLIARILVEHVTGSREEAMRLNGGVPPWDGAQQFVIGPVEESQAKRDINLGDVARRLVFEGEASRLPNNFSGRHLQAMRRLTPESGALLDRAWTAGEIDAPPRFTWQRDELILALDLYLRLERIVPDETHPEVIALSQLLQSLPLHTDRRLDPTFRNPDGVALKLANFRAIEHPGRGMSRGNKLEQVVWDELAGDPVRLRRVAQAIAEGSSLPESQAPSDSDDEESEFEEGRVVYRLHRARERNPRLVAAKKRQVLRDGGALVCEVCGFDFEAFYGDQGRGYIECHHAIAVSTMAPGAATRLEDVALVCANCHRMVHRWRPWLSLSALSTLLRRSFSA